MDSVVSGRSSFGDVGVDPQAFNRFWEVCAPVSRRFLGRTFGHLRGMATEPFDEVLEDAVRMAFIQARARWYTYNPALASVQTWVNRIAHNHFLKEWWYAQQWIQHRAPLEDGDDVPAADGTEPVLVRTAVMGTLHHLPVRQAQAMYLQHGHGMSTGQVAEVLGTTPMGVESLTKRGRNAFRQAWAGTSGRRADHV